MRKLSLAFVAVAIGSAIPFADHITMSESSMVTSVAARAASSSPQSVAVVVITVFSHTTVPYLNTLPWATDLFTNAECNWDLQYCNRTGYPYYNADSNYNNPYGSADSVCSSVWESELVEYFETASLTSTSAIPGNGVSIPGQTNTVEIGSVIVTSVATGTTEIGELVTTEPNSKYAQSELETRSLVIVNAVGVMVTTLETLVRSVLTSTEYSVSWSELLTTVTAGSSIPVPVAYASPFAYSASSPCCSTCGLLGTDVQVFYWASATTTAKNVSTATTVVDAAGFTFTSPSIYVAFKSLYATDLCGTVGEVLRATTLAFSSGELSTATAYHWDEEKYQYDPYLPPLYTVADWGTVKCESITTSFWQAGDVRLDNNGYWEWDPETFSTSVAGADLYTVSYNPCSPSIAVPTQLFSINPLWSSCSQGIAGLYDPPSVLTPASNLSPATTVVPSSSVVTSVMTTTSSTSQADPASSLVSPTASKTSTPEPEPTTSTTQPASSTNSPSPAVSSTAVNNPSSSPSPSSIVNSNSQTVVTSPVINNNPSAGSPTTNIPPSTVSNPVVNDPSPASPATSNPLAVASSPVANNPSPEGPTTIISPVVDNDPSPQILTTIPLATVASLTSTSPRPALVIGTQTLLPGSQITHSGTVLSLDPSASSIVIGGTTTQALAPPTIATTSPAPAVITLGSSIISANSESAFIVGSQTLAANSQITFSGTVLSLGPSGSSLVIGGTTTQVLSPPSPSNPQAPVFTISGVMVSIVTGANTVSVGGVTYSASAASTTTVAGIGEVIWTVGGFATSASASLSSSASSPSVSMIGGGDVGSNGTVEFTSAGDKKLPRRTLWELGVMLFMVAWLV